MQWEHIFEFLNRGKQTAIMDSIHYPNSNKIYALPIRPNTSDENISLTSILYRSIQTLSKYRYIHTRE